MPRRNKSRQNLAKHLRKKRKKGYSSDTETPLDQDFIPSTVLNKPKQITKTKRKIDPDTPLKKAISTTSHNVASLNEPNPSTFSYAHPNTSEHNNETYLHTKNNLPSEAPKNIISDTISSTSESTACTSTVVQLDATDSDAPPKKTKRSYTRRSIDFSLNRRITRSSTRSTTAYETAPHYANQITDTESLTTVTTNSTASGRHTIEKCHKEPPNTYNRKRRKHCRGARKRKAPSSRQPPLDEQERPQTVDFNTTASTASRVVEQISEVDSCTSTNTTSTRCSPTKKIKQTIGQWNRENCARLRYEKQERELNKIRKKQKREILCEQFKKALKTAGPIESINLPEVTELPAVRDIVMDPPPTRKPSKYSIRKTYQYCTDADEIQEQYVKTFTTEKPQPQEEPTTESNDTSIVLSQTIVPSSFKVVSEISAVPFGNSNDEQEATDRPQSINSCIDPQQGTGIIDPQQGTSGAENNAEEQINNSIDPQQGTSGAENNAETQINNNIDSQQGSSGAEKNVEIQQNNNSIDPKQGTSGAENNAGAQQSTVKRGRPRKKLPPNSLNLRIYHLRQKRKQQQEKLKQAFVDSGFPVNQGEVFPNSEHAPSEEVEQTEISTDTGAEGAQAPNIIQQDSTAKKDQPHNKSTEQIKPLQLQRTLQLKPQTVRPSTIQISEPIAGPSGLQNIPRNFSGTTEERDMLLTYFEEERLLEIAKRQSQPRTTKKKQEKQTRQEIIQLDKPSRAQTTKQIDEESLPEGFRGCMEDRQMLLQFFQKEELNNDSFYACKRFPHPRNKELRQRVTEWLKSQPAASKSAHRAKKTLIKNDSLQAMERPPLPPDPSSFSSTVRTTSSVNWPPGSPPFGISPVMRNICDERPSPPRDIIHLRSHTKETAPDMHTIIEQDCESTHGQNEEKDEQQISETRRRQQDPYEGEENFEADIAGDIQFENNEDLYLLQDNQFNTRPEDDILEAMDDTFDQNLQNPQPVLSVHAPAIGNQPPQHNQYSQVAIEMLEEIFDEPPYSPIIDDLLDPQSPSQQESHAQENDELYMDAGDPDLSRDKDYDQSTGNRGFRRTNREQHYDIQDARMDIVARVVDDRVRNARAQSQNARNRAETASEHNSQVSINSIEAIINLDDHQQQAVVRGLPFVEAGMTANGNVPETTVRKFNMPLFNARCSSCRALHYNNKKRRNGSFYLCCHFGKIKLPNIRPPPPRGLIRELSNTTPGATILNVDVAYLRKHIIELNGGLQMTSYPSKAKTRNPPPHGPQTMIINGLPKHRLYPLRDNPGERRNWGCTEVLILDNAQRADLRHSRFPNISANIFEEIDAELLRCHPMRRSFENIRTLIINEDNLRREREEEILYYFIRERAPPAQVSREVRGRMRQPVEDQEIGIAYAGEDVPQNLTLRVYRNGGHYDLPYLHPKQIQMSLPLLLPYGGLEFRPGMRYTDGRRNISQNKLYRYYMFERRNNPGQQHYLGCGKLSQLGQLTTWLTTETSRLKWHETHQSTVMRASRQGLEDALERRAINHLEGVVAPTLAEEHRLIQQHQQREPQQQQHQQEEAQPQEQPRVNYGVRVTRLPQSFTGSRAFYKSNFNDGVQMALELGRFDALLTFTCNPNDPRITSRLRPGEQPYDRPEIITEVYNEIMKDLLSHLHEFLGDIKGYFCKVEFQKRGAPHIHVLIWLMRPIESAEQIDTIARATLPDPIREPELYALVTRLQLHGPCGRSFPNCPCMKTNKAQERVCGKNYPFAFREDTVFDNGKGFCEFRRPNDGRHFIKRGHEFTNRDVVPYSPYVLLRYGCHNNIIFVPSSRALFYCLKYCTKSPDAGNYSETVVGRRGQITVEYQSDEIADYVQYKYTSACEATWRSWNFPLFIKTHVLVKLHVHLPGDDVLYFDVGHEEDALEQAKVSTLLAWFQVNSRQDQDGALARTLNYKDIPKHFRIYRGKFVRLKAGYKPRLGRIIDVPPSRSALYALRLLVLHRKGITSFEELRTVNGELKVSFVEAATALGYLQDPDEHIRALTEAMTKRSPKGFRNYFVYLIAFSGMGNPEPLFQQFKRALCNDFLIRGFTEEAAEHRARNFIKKKITSHNLDGMLDWPEMNFDVDESLPDDPEPPEDRHQELLQMSPDTLNPLQRRAYDHVIALVQDYKNPNTPHRERVLIIDGPGGTGKTHLIKTICGSLIQYDNGPAEQPGVVFQNSCFTGIAAQLIPYGQTVHSCYQLPLNIDKDSLSLMNEDSYKAQRLRDSVVLIVDEVSMLSTHMLSIIDKLLKQLMHNNIIFGGKVVLLVGDPRQIPPFTRGALRDQMIELSGYMSPLLNTCRRIRLESNQRAANDPEFAEYLLTIGDGRHQQVSQNRPRYVVEVPADLIISQDNMIDFVFDDFRAATTAAILAPTNKSVDRMNSLILERFPGEVITTFADDQQVVSGNAADFRYPVEFMHSIHPHGFPPYQLDLKINCVVTCLKNLNPSEGLCNGTRLQVVDVSPYILTVKIIAGEFAENIHYLPKIIFEDDGQRNGLHFKRKQFPVKLGFAMTINKSQGQTLDKVGLLLSSPCFTHGQYYVALSRVRNRANLKVTFGSSLTHHGRIRIEGDRGDREIYATHNIVYPQIRERAEAIGTPL